MAAKATKLNTTLLIKYCEGRDEKGRDIIKKVRFSKVKTKAQEQDLLDVASEIEKLLGVTLDEVIREDQSGITTV